MGSKGSKPRKPQHSQHLPKVGTPEENKREQHGEREAVLDNMGLRGASSTTKMIVGVVLVAIVVIGIFALLGLNTFW